LKPHLTSPCLPSAYHHQRGGWLLYCPMRHEHCPTACCFLTFCRQSPANHTLTPETPETVVYGRYDFEICAPSATKTAPQEQEKFTEPWTEVYLTLNQPIQPHHDTQEVTAMVRHDICNTCVCQLQLCQKATFFTVDCPKRSPIRSPHQEAAAHA